MRHRLAELMSDVLGFTMKGPVVQLTAQFEPEQLRKLLPLLLGLFRLLRGLPLPSLRKHGPIYGARRQVTLVTGVSV